MPADVRELRVFMASPGDLDDERDALRAVERRINALFRERGVRVSISGWEEVQPEAGRPQALINPLVHECEIFIGLLNMRWGSATGTHSSGFEEEFEIALARRVDDDLPAIGMFFRAIESERLADKGPQLTAVLEFQERVRQERLALYKTFNTADQLALEIFDFLAPYAMRIADEIAASAVEAVPQVAGSAPTMVEPAGVESSGAAEPHVSDGLEDGKTPRELDSAQRQIVDALSGLSAMFTGEVAPDDAIRDRVTLVGTAFAKDQGFLATHHVNRLYSRRAELDLTLGEARAWYRTHFANVGTTDRNSRTIPIWGVIDVHEIEGRFDAELSALVQDDEESVARGVLRFLANHAIRPKQLWATDIGNADPGTSAAPEAEGPSWDKTVRRWAALFKHFPVVDVTLNYLAELATVDDHPLLKAIATSADVDENSRRVVDALAGTLKGDLGSCDDLTPPKYRSDTLAVRRLLIDVMPRLDPSQWDSMLKGTHEAISAAAAVQLMKHEEVTEQQLKAATDLDDAAVQDAMVERAGRDLDWAVSTIQALNNLDKYSSGHLVSRLLAVSSPPDVLDALDAKETLSVSYWVARTIQDPETFLDVAREVLDDTAEFLNNRTDPLRGKYDSVAAHLIATAKAAACDVLANPANTTKLEAIDFARVADELQRDHYVSRESASQALVKMTTQLGRGVPEIGDLAVFDGYRAVLETERILASPLAASIVPIWRKSTIVRLQTAAHMWELKQPDTTDETLEEALYLDDENVRMVAVDQLIARWDEDQLTDLLIRYDQQDRAYWYNIIAALDERLYGYSSIRESQSHEDASGP